MTSLQKKVDDKGSNPKENAGVLMQLVTVPSNQDNLVSVGVNNVWKAMQSIVITASNVVESTIPLATVARETDEGYPTGPDVAFPVKSSGCNCCQAEEKAVPFKRCSTCKLVFYCSAECHRRHWNEHQVICKVNQGLPKPQGEHARGLG